MGGDKKDYWLQRAEEYLAHCLIVKAAPRASELATRVGMSPVQLTRAFQAAVGENVSEYLKKRQLERAKSLLRSTDRTVAQIALEAGFGTPRTLYRIFKRMAGLTPQEYRHFEDEL